MKEEVLGCMSQKKKVEPLLCNLGSQIAAPQLRRHAMAKFSRALVIRGCDLEDGGVGS